MKDRNGAVTAHPGDARRWTVWGGCVLLCCVGCTGDLDLSAYGGQDAGRTAADAGNVGDGGDASTSTGDAAASSGSSGDAGGGASGGNDAGGNGGTDAGNNAGGNDGGGFDDAGGNGSSDDAGGNNAGSDDAGEPPAGNVPAFLAIGHMGRRTLSCDDGQSWPIHTSVDDGFQCWLNGADYGMSDCSDHSWAGRGLAYLDGVFAASFGWGPTTQGGIYSSTDGVNWSSATSDTTFADLSAGAGTFFASDRAAPRTSSDGNTWATGGAMSLAQGVFNVRKSAVFRYGGGTRIVVAASTPNAGEDIVYSSDMGATWTQAASVPAGCATDTEGVVAGDGVVITLSGSGVLCRSTDGGANWSQQSLGGSFNSNPVWTGSEFMAWTGSAVHRSSDGSSWSSESLTPGFVNLGPVAASPEGTFVSSNAGQPWYGQQQFFRSTDGVTWQTLDSSAFTGSHPITQIVWGTVAPTSGGCAAN